MSKQENVNMVQQMYADFRRGNIPGKQEVELSRLGAFEWFAGLNEEDLAEISLTCEERTVQPGTIIIRQGQVGNEVYLMEEGSVAIYRERTGASELLAVLHAPTVFGEMAIVNPERVRTASLNAGARIDQEAPRKRRFLAVQN